MAQCKSTPQEFIQNAFSPVIAVMCSSLVDQACRKNNLSFIELLQPFCKLNVEAQIRDPSGIPISIKNLRITILDVNTRPPPPTLARKFLNSSVAQLSDVRTTSINVNNYNLDIPSSVPWFETWRDTFLQVQYPSDHEFTKHFLACIIVISSIETNPLDTLNNMLQNLTQMQASKQAKLPKWFNTNVLRYFVILHDTLEGQNESALETFESFKKLYGDNNCFLLQMNSRPPGLSDDHLLPDPWSQFLLRKAEYIEISENETFNNLTDSSSVTSMPNNVTVSDCANATLSMPGTSSITTSTVQKLEIGQEANEISTMPPLIPVMLHPLSPDIENRKIDGTATDGDDSFNCLTKSNVWPAPSSPNLVHGACLTTDDIEQLKLLVHDFCLKSLLPHVEKQIQQLSDLISNKKGVSRSLFTATKRWFTPNKLGSLSSTQSINAVIYANDSPELQLRRLADLYFMFGHYTMAFQIYHTAKRDFNIDQAWLYYAGALEMAGLSAFMANEVTRKTCDYLEESIITYLHTCRMPQFATRATLLSTECLKGKHQYGEAAHQLIRMTSEDSDLRSALLLEQAAYCFLQSNRQKMFRKYAFHIVLAGHRFSKCLQKKHSLRCYRQAFQVYNDKGWSLAEDHIHFTIGRQAFVLKQLDEATEAFSQLLTQTSKQNAEQQAIFLKEYLNAHYVLFKASSEENQVLPLLPLPILNNSETKVLLGPQAPLSTPGRVPASGVSFASEVHHSIYNKWNKLEEMMVQESMGTLPLVFKPMVTFYSDKNFCNTKPIAIMGEPIQISVSLHNILQIVLPLKTIYLLWKFTDNNGQVITNECNNDTAINTVIRTHCLECTNLASHSKKELILSVTPLSIGELVITGVQYTIVNNIDDDNSVSVTGKQVFHIRGPKLNTKEKQNQQTVVYGEDRRLNITIAPCAPCLQVSFSEINQEVLCNEIQNVSIELRNCGSTPLHKIMLASSLPHLFSLSSTIPARLNKASEEDLTNPAIREREIRKSHVMPITLPSSFNHKLEPGQSHIIHLWFRAPETKGTAIIDLIFYYENVIPNCVPRYRLVKHLWHLSVQDSLKTELNTRHSCDCSNIEMLTLSLRATNSNQIHHAVVSEITLLQASLISSNWKLAENVTIPRDVKLQSQESVHFLLKVYRSVKNDESLNYSDLLLSLSMKVNPDMKMPSMNFIQRSMQCKLNAFETSTETKYFNNSMEALLILGWHALVTDSAGNKRTIFGQHYVPVQKLTKTVNSIKDSSVFSLNSEHISLSETTSTNALQKQVMYNLIHPPVMSHDFLNNKVCIVPVKLILHSSANTDLVIKVNTIGTSSGLSLNLFKNELFNPNSLSYFRWMGHSEFIYNIKPFCSHQLLLNVAILAPGTYDLGGRIEILCRPPDQPYEPVIQICRIQSSLIVKCTNQNQITL